MASVPLRMANIPFLLRLMMTSLVVAPLKLSYFMHSSPPLRVFPELAGLDDTLPELRSSSYWLILHVVTVSALMVCLSAWYYSARKGLDTAVCLLHWMVLLSVLANCNHLTVLMSGPAAVGANVLVLSLLALSLPREFALSATLMHGAADRLPCVRMLKDCTGNINVYLFALGIPWWGELAACLYHATVVSVTLLMVSFTLWTVVERCGSPPNQVSTSSIGSKDE